MYLQPDYVHTTRRMSRWSTINRGPEGWTCQHEPEESGRIAAKESPKNGIINVPRTSRRSTWNPISNAPYLDLTYTWYTTARTYCNAVTQLKDMNTYNVRKQYCYSNNSYQVLYIHKLTTSTYNKFQFWEEIWRRWVSLTQPLILGPKPFQTILHFCFKTCIALHFQHIYFWFLWSYTHPQPTKHNTTTRQSGNTSKNTYLLSFWRRLHWDAYHDCLD